MANFFTPNFWRTLISSFEFESEFKCVRGTDTVGFLRLFGHFWGFFCDDAEFVSFAGNKQLLLNLPKKLFAKLLAEIPESFCCGFAEMYGSKTVQQKLAR